MILGEDLDPGVPAESVEIGAARVLQPDEWIDPRLDATNVGALKRRECPLFGRTYSKWPVGSGVDRACAASEPLEDERDRDD